MNDKDDDTRSRLRRRFSHIQSEIPTQPSQDQKGRRQERLSFHPLIVGLVATGVIVVVIGGAIASGRVTPVGSTPSTPSASQPASADSTQSPTSSRSAAPSATQSAAGDRWKVDVINGNREVIVSITTDDSFWAWTIAPGERTELLDQAAAHAGHIEVLDLAEGTRCALLASSDFWPMSFTIELSQAVDSRRYLLKLSAGTSLPGPPDTEFTGGCSG